MNQAKRESKANGPAGERNCLKLSGVVSLEFGGGICLRLSYIADVLARVWRFKQVPTYYLSSGVILSPNGRKKRETDDNNGK